MNDTQNLSPAFLVLQAQKQDSPARQGEDSSKGKRETGIEVDFDFAFCDKTKPVIRYVKVRVLNLFSKVLTFYFEIMCMHLSKLWVTLESRALKD